MSKKIMIASDLHGSSLYVNNMLNLFDKENCDILLLLGDLLYHGPRNDLPYEYEVKKVADSLNKYKNKILAIRGNCDSDVDQMMFEFPIMQESMILNFDDIVFYASHGHIYNENNLPPFANINVLLNGHYHIPAFNKHNNFIYVNPGSVSIPKAGSTHSLIIYNDKCFNFYDISDIKNINIYRTETV